MTPPMPAEAIPDLDRLWEYDRPAESEARFRALLDTARTDGAAGFHAELLTQIARAQGLQGRFNDADATLDEAAVLLEPAGPRARVRWLLERGRLRNSSGRAAEAAPLFLEAFEVAEKSGEEALAVDAAHMLAIAELPERQLAWHRRALALAEGSMDPKANAWLGSLLNNLGWTLHAAGEYDQALGVFQQALAWREARDRPVETRIARWAVARCLRSMGRVEEALAIQRRLRTELDDSGGDDPYVDQEIGECLVALGQVPEPTP
jgi:tetratricopeptide (TPR) repeat protein